MSRSSSKDKHRSQSLDKGRPISLADLIRVVKTLEIPPDDFELLGSAARLLGFDIREPAAVEPTQEKPPAPPEPEKLPLADQLEEEREPPPPPPLRDRWKEAPPQNRQRKLRPLRVKPPEPPLELLRTKVLPEPEEQPPGSSLELDPLFEARWTRHILSGTLAVRRAEGPIDVEEITRIVSRGEAFREVPRRLWPTLKRRVVVLTDRAEGMEPFQQDQEQLLIELERVVGMPRLRVFDFEGCPSRGVGTSTDFEWGPFLCPPAGTAVVLLSDLGTAPIRVRENPVPISEWVDFLRHLSVGGCPVACMTPYEPDRCPDALRRWLTLIHWDRPTSPGSIRRLLARGLPVRGRDWRE